MMNSHIHWKIGGWMTRKNLLKTIQETGLRKPLRWSQGFGYRRKGIKFWVKCQNMKIYLLMLYWITLLGIMNTVIYAMRQFQNMRVISMKDIPIVKIGYV